jgi:DNA-binding CsgD family transcriptional regulator
VSSLVAREGEVADALRSITGGRGVVIAGPAGVGKTALANAVSDRLVAAGTPRPVLVIATVAAAQIPFGALAALLPSDLSTVHPALVPSLLARRLAQRATRDRPLLVIDDVHLLDPASAAAVVSLSAAGTVGLLATAGTQVATAASADAVVALWKAGLVDRIDLGPFDRDATRALLRDRLDGPVASSTVERLWALTEGNALYLTELIRFGVDTGRLREVSGMWWWDGATGVPPRLGELLERRLDEASAPARDAIDMLALGEPLPYETLAAVVPADAIVQLEHHGVLTSDERDGVIRLRFAHPLLTRLAADRLTPVRRRALAGRLRAVAADDVDVVRRASWEEAAGGTPNVELLLAAADAVMLSDPSAAVRFARRAVGHDASPRAGIALSAAHAEAGQPTDARAALTAARVLVRTAAERRAAGLEDISLSLWSERRPDRAFAELAALRAELPAEVYRDGLDSVEALLLVFTARPDRALCVADQVLAREPDADTEVRALTARLAALTRGDDSAAALAGADTLLAALDRTPVAATRAGLAHAFVAEARLFHGDGLELPRMIGRWPDAAATAGGSGAAWPLLDGIRRNLAGDWIAAQHALREAAVQQRHGEGLFRSEAAAGLIVALAEGGQTDEAAELLAASPPDAVALVPGLLPWSRAAVHAALGRQDAGELGLEAAAAARDVGAVPIALWYLSDTARHGYADAAARAAAELPAQSRLSRVRLAGIDARASGDGDRLLDAAERHLALGLAGQAGELARLALGRTPGRRSDPRAARILRRAATLLGKAAPAADLGLTGRELEIARLAAEGRTDREIADCLVVSVRTVESHLAAAYRKLGIRSRKDLAASLGTP